MWLSNPVQLPDTAFRLLRAVILLTVVLCTLFLPGAGRVHADDLSDFEAARSLYEQQSYGRAVDSFRLLVGTDPPRLTDRLLVLESRKYLAASLLFMGAEAEARTQFRWLLQQEPAYTLDPLAFPTEVLLQFEQVKRAQREEQAERRRLEEETKLRMQEALVEAERRRTENLARLRELASTSEIRERNSRWIASVPFGVGQFQNGDRGLGVALGILEGLAATTSITSYIAYERLADSRPGAGEAAWRTANVTSFSVFIALALIGIIDAHVRFVPERVQTQPRKLPPDLDRWLREQTRQAPGSPGATVLRF